MAICPKNNYYNILFSFANVCYYEFDVLGTLSQLMILKQKVCITFVSQEQLIAAHEQYASSLPFWHCLIIIFLFVCRSLYHVCRRRWLSSRTRMRRSAGSSRRPTSAHPLVQGRSPVSNLHVSGIALHFRLESGHTSLECFV